jgi:uncharacterized protein with PhoU and TrkA domain
MDSNSIDNLGVDIASKMLMALTLEPGDEEIEKITVPIEDQKRYIKKYIDTIGLDGRKNMGDILIRNDKRNLLQPCAEGIIINLDALPAYIIEQMYDLTSYKINHRS